MVTITQYGEMEQYVRFFAEGNIPAMILQSHGGIGKTQTVKNILDELKVDYIYKSGHMTVTELVRLFYEHPDDIIVIDDVDALFENSRTFNILRAACDTTQDRTVQYASPSYTVADLPKEFSVSAPVLLLVNSFPDSPAIRAFKTRAVCVEFKPTYGEVSAKLHAIVDVAGSVVKKDEEVLDFFDKLAPVSKAPNFRAYILATTMKPAGLGWEKFLTESMGVDPLLGAVVKATKEGKNYKERVAEFTKMTGKTARTYSRTLRDYRGVLK